MTKEEIKNTPELVDFMLDKCVLADSRAKVRRRLEEVCEMAIEALEREPIFYKKIRTEIDRQQKWLLQAGYTAYNVDIAFDAIKAVVTESEGEE